MAENAFDDQVGIRTVPHGTSDFWVGVWLAAGASKGAGMPQATRRERHRPRGRTAGPAPSCCRAAAARADPARPRPARSARAPTRGIPPSPTCARSTSTPGRPPSCPSPPWCALTTLVLLLCCCHSCSSLTRLAQPCLLVRGGPHPAWRVLLSGTSSAATAGSAFCLRAPAGVPSQPQPRCRRQGAAHPGRGGHPAVPPGHLGHRPLLRAGARSAAKLPARTARTHL